MFSCLQGLSIPQTNPTKPALSTSGVCQPCWLNPVCSARTGQQNDCGAMGGAQLQVTQAWGREQPVAVMCTQRQSEQTGKRQEIVTVCETAGQKACSVRSFILTQHWERCGQALCYQMQPSAALLPVQFVILHPDWEHGTVLGLSAWASAF